MDEKSSFKTSKSNIPSNISWLYFIIIIINTIFGLQILSSFFSLLVNFLRERPTISLFQVALYALVTFILVFLTGFFFKGLSKRVLFLVLIISISVIRFIIQVCRWAPLSLAVSALGTILWIVSLVFFISLVQQRKIKLFFTFFPALLFGFAATTAISSLLGTWDMIWRPDPIIIFFAVLVIAVQIKLSVAVYHDLERDKKYSDGSRAVFYSLVIVMPFVFLQFYQFQNLAAFNALTGFNLIISSTIIIASNVAALSFTYLIAVKKLRIPLTIVSAIIAVLAFWPEVSGIPYIFQTVLGNLACWWLLLAVLNRSVSYSSEKIPWKNTSAFGIGGILLFIFAFVYYGSYDLKLPVKSWMIPVLAAVILAVMGILSVCLKPSIKRGEPKKMESYSKTGTSEKAVFLKKGFTEYILIFLMLSLLIAPIMITLPSGYKPATRIQRDTVRVLNYNIHQGFNIDGYLDPESIARVIEKNGADIVCLNEVSRGWIINGSADLYEWFANRLDMKYKLFMPASDLIWGNAILSKFPLKLISSGFLPRMDAPLRRSYLFAEVDLSSAGIKNINALSTHIHQIADEGYKREAQVKALLEAWNGLERTAIFGDFNAVTGDPEISMMQNAGFIDSQLALGKQDELTWIHYKPYQRIDYIWVTPDLEISNFQVTYSRASDHLPVSMDIK
jgi:endonuclease/exonuclease/phosphatase family metal-dependent hydrolase